MSIRPTLTRALFAQIAHSVSAAAWTVAILGCPLLVFGQSRHADTIAAVLPALVVLGCAAWLASEILDAPPAPEQTSSGDRHDVDTTRPMERAR